MTRSVTDSARADLENVFETLKGDGDDAWVAADEEVAEGLDAADADQVLDLFVAAAGGGVADGPGRLLLDVKLGLTQQLHQDRHQTRLYHRLQVQPTMNRSMH